MFSRKTLSFWVTRVRLCSSWQPSQLHRVKESAWNLLRQTQDRWNFHCNHYRWLVVFGFLYRRSYCSLSIMGDNIIIFTSCSCGIYLHTSTKNFESWFFILLQISSIMKVRTLGKLSKRWYSYAACLYNVGNMYISLHRNKKNVFPCKQHHTVLQCYHLIACPAARNTAALSQAWMLANFVARLSSPVEYLLRLAEFADLMWVFWRCVKFIRYRIYIAYTSSSADTVNAAKYDNFCLYIKKKNFCIIHAIVPTKLLIQSVTLL